MEPAPCSPSAWSCSKVAAALRHGDPILLLDVRPAAQYEAGHISGALSLACSALLQRRLAKNLVSILDVASPGDRQKLLASDAPPIVLYDDDSVHLSEESTLAVFLRATRAVQPRSVGHLAGGFGALSRAYPELVEGGRGTHPAAMLLQLPVLQSAVSSPRTPLSSSPPRSAPPGRTPHPSAAPTAVPVTQVLPGLFLGTAADAQDYPLLRRLGVTHVLNVTTHVPAYFSSTLAYSHVPLLDTPDADLAVHLPAACRFIAHARGSGGGVLVHCAAGISRSVAVVLAYLIASQHWTLAAAFSYLRALRPTASPNLGFMGQLLAWEKQQLAGPIDVSPENGVPPHTPSTPMASKA